MVKTIINFFKADYLFQPVFVCVEISQHTLSYLITQEHELTTGTSVVLILLEYCAKENTKLLVFVKQLASISKNPKS